ncbi:hypothetical protein [Streptomyces sp. NPDC005538]|uniref:hypothetical protein n=1 Tax=unclassified Streptomyces TaxID=2593676 RepID=UPI0033A05941
MNNNMWGQPAWQPQNPQGEFVLPHNIRGPFVSEFTPTGPYRHRSAQVASVLFYRNGGHSVVTVRGAEHYNKPLMGKPTSVCWIARGQHQVSFQLELPSYGDRSRFKAAADVNWEVHDFYLAAEKRVVDVERMLRPPLEARLRGISRRHNLDSAQQADEAIQEELASGRWNDFGAELGLITQVFIRIDLGQAASDHHAHMVAVQSGSEVQKAIDAANNARIEANMEAARGLIAAGEADQYAHVLAQDPSRAQEILGALQHQAREQRKGALDYLTNLINQGVVQRHQIDDQVQALIDFSRTAANGVFQNGLPPAPTALPVPPTPPAPPIPPAPLVPPPAVTSAPTAPAAPPHPGTDGPDAAPDTAKDEPGGWT